MESRDPYVKIWQDLAIDKSMIFVSGPRQAGKTTLAQMISASFTNSLYFNWDIAEHRTRLIEDPTFFEAVERKDSSTPLIVFDEIHKYKDWKNYLKGVYDQFHGSFQFLVSGSGRLDIYQKGGDSLAGRYFLFHLWPFTLAELGKSNSTIDEFLNDPLQISMQGHDELKKIWSRLSELSGFPEPYLAGRITTYRRWSNTYSQQLIREDIRDLTGIKSVRDVETLYLLLPSKVGSPLSVPSMARDLKVAYNSVRSWLSVFERFFLIFSISAWTRKIARAIQKERKVYLWDTPRITEPAARFENMVAAELWRAVTAWNDMGCGLFSLHFIKNKEQQEVDFLIANGGEPFLLIEAKLSDTQPSLALKKFQRALNVPAVQLTAEGDGYRMLSNVDKSILVAPAYQWLSRLP
ncbi:MAG: ATP-binding protein [Deltaproteobacteria bacterium]|nr:ATP-binding protein [Deltaproteobacteria bacterium]MBW2020361.1 ATP-binding protein [Deltaproteobacteria bacterium]MBW2075239.1 ATP-binding protein [Deltaproteobacteria bacterium]